MINYMPRIMDELLRRELESFGAVLLAGPKWCGKTTTAKQIARSVLNLHSPDQQETYLQLADIKPSLLLDGEHPRLIDEWQMAPQLWDAIRHDVDVKSTEGLYILTGSTSVDETKIKHSGAGRISRLKMYTMSLYESQDSNGTVSLSDLLENSTNVAAKSDLMIEDYARLIVRGGWPSTIGKSNAVVQRQIAGYCDAIVKSDMSTIDGVSRDERKVSSLLRSYSRHTATQAPKTTIQKDILQNNEMMHINTLDSYINALNHLFVIDDVPAWSPWLRSKTSIRTADTRHFIDPAIAAYFLQAYPQTLLSDINTFGLLFESLVVRDLRVYAQANYGHVSHYRDSSGLEADIIIHLSDGRWAAVEVKLGSKQVDAGAANLLALKEKIDSSRTPEPSLLMIITGTEYAYTRSDGVVVVPLGCLKP
jgi:predicted AAA+ superfamily ATPase